MSSTSKKHRNFVSEPMRSKRVTELAGIGEALGERLQDRGYDKASNVLGQYLVLRQDRTRFVDWMRATTGANTRQANGCYQCLDDWSREYL
ncbi:barrier-to-autointegration factor-like [Haemaphysalis longicornis]